MPCARASVSGARQRAATLLTGGAARAHGVAVGAVGGDERGLFGGWVGGWVGRWGG